VSAGLFRITDDSFDRSEGIKKKNDNTSHIHLNFAVSRFRKLSQNMKYPDI
jgi:hypothetical protein